MYLETNSTHSFSTVFSESTTPAQRNPLLLHSVLGPGRKPSVLVSKRTRFDVVTVVPNLKVTEALQVEAPTLLRLQPPTPRPNQHPLHTQI